MCLCVCKYLVFSKAFRHWHVSSIFVCAQLRREECNAFGKQEEFFGVVPSTIFLTDGNFWETKFYALLDILVGFFQVEILYLVRSGL